MIQSSLDALVAFFTLGVLLSPVWVPATLIVRGRRRRAATAAAQARAWADAEQVALWEARKTGPDTTPEGEVVVHVFVVRVARLHLQFRHVGTATTVATLTARLDDRSYDPARFALDVEEAMDRARGIAAGLNSTRLV